MAEFVIIADDLSGACDTAVQFSNAGYKTIVLNKTAHLLSLDPGFRGVAITTNSRDTTQVNAKEKIKDACYILKGLVDTTFYKKIDSTWRGNIGAELEILIEELGFKFAIISSVYPKNRRVGIGGYLLVDGQLLHHTPMANDPASPIKEGYLPSLLQKQTALPIEHISLQTIEKGSQIVAQFILEKLHPEKPSLFIADAIEECHLDVLASLEKEDLPPHIYAGSAGLSAAILRQKNNTMLDVALPVLTVIGSVHPNSNLQVDEMIKKLGVKEIYVPWQNLIGFSQNGLKDLALEVIKTLEKREDLVIRTSRTASDVELAKSEGIRHGLSNVEMVNKVSLGLQEFMAGILGKVKLAGLMVTGGTTALQLLEGAHATGIEVTEELEPGIPLGKIIGGALNGVSIITKAGGFGSLEVFCNGAEILKQKERAANGK